MTTQPEDNKTTTWSVRCSSVFTKEQAEQITKKATRWQKLRLFFRPSHYSIDGKSVIRYKRMGGMLFVMKRGTKL